MGTGDLKGWFLELANLNNPIRRKFHLFTLLCGSRPTALQQVKPEHINFRRRTLHILKPKGGSKRAFDIPLSREMILSLIRVLRFGRQMQSCQAQEWLPDDYDVTFEEMKAAFEDGDFKIELDDNALISLEFQMLDHTIPLLHKRGQHLLRAPDGLAGFITSDRPYASPRSDAFSGP